MLFLEFLFLLCIFEFVYKVVEWFWMLSFVFVGRVFLLSFCGVGFKSVECICLLCLYYFFFFVRNDVFFCVELWLLEYIKLLGSVILLSGIKILRWWIGWYKCWVDCCVFGLGFIGVFIWRNLVVFIGIVSECWFICLICENKLNCYFKICMWVYFNCWYVGWV